MSDEQDQERREPTKTDLAASEACTRSGTFALLLSVVLVLLVPYWRERPVDNALSRYVAARWDLVITLDRMDDDPIWQKYAASRSRVGPMSVQEMVGARMAISSGASAPAFRLDYGEPPVKVPLTNGPSGPHLVPAKPPGGRPAARGEGATVKSKPPGWRPAPPGPPTGLTVTEYQGIPEVNNIPKYLELLNDSQMLTEARRYSNSIDMSIALWTQKRADLIYRNAVSSGCAKAEIEVPHDAQEPVDFVPALNTDVMLQCTTLRDVRELAKYQLPQLANTADLGGRIGRQVDLRPGALPHDPYAASVVAELLLFLVVFYFGAYAREASSSPAFPVRGTLFGSFSGGWSRLFVFLVALWSPFLASLALAVTSREWIVVAVCALIFSAVLSTHLVLGRKSYFGPLLPQVIREWAWRKLRA